LPKLRRYFSPCTIGLEEVLERELTDLGALQVERRRGGVHYRGDLALGYASCIWLRTAVRVQEEIAHGQVDNKQDLYDLVSAMTWAQYMDVDQTLGVDASIRDSFARDPRTASLTVKDAIVDQFRDREGRRPSVERKLPHLPLRIILQGNHARLYRDFCGESLHKRGYRPIQVKSPVNESLAAGLLLLAGWDRRSSLLDPMCGSATILIEAALLAGDRAPGLAKSFPFDLWPDFEADSWTRLVADAEHRAADGAANIPRLFGADRHSGALSVARKAVQTAGVAKYITLETSRISDLNPADHYDNIFVNPPYGERIGEEEDLERSWHDLGTFLHERCHGATAFVLSGNPALTKQLRLRASRKWPVKNGPLDCRLVQYNLRPR